MEAGKASGDRRVLLAFGLIVVFFGLNFVAVRFSNRELAPLWGAALRFAVASVILFSLTVFMKIPLPRGGGLRGAILFGVFAFFAAYALAYWGMTRVPAGMASVLFATIPLLTLFMAVSIGLEPWRLRAFGGGILTLAGMAVVFQDQLSTNVPLVSMLAVIAGASFAAASGIVLKKSPRTNPFATTAVAMAVGTIMLFGTSLLAGETLRPPTQAPTWAALGWLITSSVVAFALLVWVLSRWTASATSYQAVLSPLVTYFAASSLAGEPLSLVFLAGSGLVLAGVYLGTALKRGPRSPAPEDRAAGAG